MEGTAAPQRHEPRWPASIAVLCAIGFYVALPSELLLGPRWLIPALAGALLVVVNAVRRYRWVREAAEVRSFAIGLISLVNVANVVSVARLVDQLISGHIGARRLLFGAVSVWLTNVIVFALWFWELDRGGPRERELESGRYPDFFYPQMANPGLAPPDWRPGFVDYLYVSVTNAAAFSPTDTMPLTRIAKALMTAESLVSLVTVGVVAARAVNILG